MEEEAAVEEEAARREAEAEAEEEEEAEEAEEGGGGVVPPRAAKNGTSPSGAASCGARAALKLHTRKVEAGTRQLPVERQRDLVVKKGERRNSPHRLPPGFPLREHLVAALRGSGAVVVAGVARRPVSICIEVDPDLLPRRKLPRCKVDLETESIDCNSNYVRSNAK